MSSGFRALATAMFKGFFRDRMALFFAILFPLMFLVLLGGVIGGDGNTSKVSVLQAGDIELLDRMPPAAKKQFAQSVEIERVDDADAAREKVRKGDADALVQSSGDTLALTYSAADQVQASVVQGMFRGIVDTANIQISGQPPRFKLEPRQIEDESLSAIQFLTPGLLGWAVAMSATFGAAVNLVLWRTNGLLRRLRLAPVRTASVVNARVAVSLVVALVQAAIFISVGVVGFGLQLTGSWPMIIPLLIAGTLAFLSLGLLAGAVAKTEEAAVGIANFVVLPMAFLSGSFFPLDLAPSWVQSLGKALPLYHLNQGMLDTMVRGEGPGAVVVPIIVLLGFSVVISAIAAKLFRWDR